MKKTWKKLIALLLVLLIVSALMPLSAWAEETKDTKAETKTEEKKDDEKKKDEKEDKTVYCDGVPGEMVEVGSGDEKTLVFMKYPDINDRYLEINRIWAGRIKATPENGSLKIMAEDWFSFNSFVSDALAERKDVEVEFGFLQEDGQRVSLKIPAGTDVASYMDGKEVIEFAALAKALGVDTPAFKDD